MKIVMGPGRHPISTAVMVYFDGRTNGLRIFLRREAHHARGRGHLPPAPIPARPYNVLHVGLGPDFPAMEAVMTPAKPTLKAV